MTRGEPTEPNTSRGKGVSEPSFCDLAEEMRDRLDAYYGWRTMPGYVTISVDALKRWTAGMERASLVIEGPAT